MTIFSKSTFIATALFAILSLVIPVVVQARPPIPRKPICDSFVIGPGTFVVNQSNHIVVEMDGWNGPKGVDKPIKYHLENNADATTGKVDGVIEGNKINFRAHWDPHPGSAAWNEYSGTIGDDGFARGTTRNNSGAQNNWGSVQPLQCAGSPKVDQGSPGYSALAISWQSHRWATAEGLEKKVDAVNNVVKQCYTAQGGCDFWTVPDDKGACVAGFVPSAGGPIVEYGPDPATVESALRRHNEPVLGFASVCATSGRLAGGPVFHSGQFEWAQSAKPSAITLRFDPLNFGATTAWVGISNNTGKPSVNCTFNDGILPPKPFTVTGDKETPINLPGVVVGITYTVTVTCGALTHTEQKQF